MNTTVDDNTIFGNGSHNEVVFVRCCLRSRSSISIQNLGVSRHECVLAMMCLHSSTRLFTPCQIFLHCSIQILQAHARIGLKRLSSRNTTGVGYGILHLQLHIVRDTPIDLDSSLRKHVPILGNAVAVSVTTSAEYRTLCLLTLLHCDLFLVADRVQRASQASWSSY